MRGSVHESIYNNLPKTGLLTYCLDTYVLGIIKVNSLQYMFSRERVHAGDAYQAKLTKQPRLAVSHSGLCARIEVPHQSFTCLPPQLNAPTVFKTAPANQQRPPYKRLSVARSTSQSPRSFASEWDMTLAISVTPLCRVSFIPTLS